MSTPTPIDEVRIGSVKATIWQNQVGDDGAIRLQRHLRTALPLRRRRQVEDHPELRPQRPARALQAGRPGPHPHLRAAREARGRRRLEHRLRRRRPRPSPAFGRLQGPVPIRRGRSRQGSGTRVAERTTHCSVAANVAERWRPMDPFVLAGRRTRVAGQRTMLRQPGRQLAAQSRVSW